MKILFILGNGFDINAGLKTAYPSFYERYVNLPSSRECVERMKKAIKHGKDATWADLEEGLGEFSATCTKNDFLYCLSDIKAELKAYLKSETDGKIIAGINVEDFIHPEWHLEPQQKHNYISLLPNNNFIKGQVDIISLNYTNTLEGLLGVEVKDNESIYGHFLKGDFRLGRIVHLHGLLDKEMDMGVNDDSQIKNKSIIDRDIVEEFVKPEYNDAAMNTNNELAAELINQTDTIIIFGSSLGVTDKKWWTLIGQNVEKRDCGLIYFVRDESKDDSIYPNYRKRWIREMMGVVKQRFELSGDVEVYMKRICIGLNKPIFSSVKILKG